MIYTEENRRGYLTWGGAFRFVGPHPCPRCQQEVATGPRTAFCDACRVDPARLAALVIRQQSYKRRYREKIKRGASMVVGREKTA
jgi:hypothetical protein